MFFKKEITTETKHTANMKFSLATLVFGLVAMSSAIPQNQNRPVPNGQCCVANTSLKQDACNVNGQRGRCVPGGNNCAFYPLLDLLT